MTGSEYSLSLKDHIDRLYKDNYFVNLLEIKIDEVVPGKAVLSMPILDKHTNLYKAVHGGALASLADTAMGMSCITLGNKVVTIDMNINFIHNINAQNVVKVIGKVIHSGSQTMVAEADLLTMDNKLLAKARGTFYVLGKCEDLPHASVS